MLRSCRSWLLPILLIAIAARVSARQSETEQVDAAEQYRQQVTELVQPLIDQKWAHAIAVGFLKGGEEHYFGFGNLNPGEAAKVPDGDSVFEIGSITKVFTALVLASLAADGEVDLADPLQQFVPESMKIPTPGGKPITLENLASHQSGLPNIPISFWVIGDNIYDSNVGGKRWGLFGEPNLEAFFRFPAPPLDDERKYQYSNLGSGTLGYALERHTGIELGQLIQQRICQPLGMGSTSFEINPDGPGFDADGEPVNNWPLNRSIIGGAFALRSSCRDMLALGRAHLEPDDSPMAAAIKLAIKPRGKINALEQTALGWRVNRYGVVSSNGATGGYRAAMFIHPPTNSAFVMLTNTQMGGAIGGRGNLFDQLSGLLFNKLLDAQFQMPELPELDEQANGQLNEFVGQYKNSDGSGDPSISVKFERDRLWMLGPGKLWLKLWPSGKDRFFVRFFLGELKFQRDEAGKVTGAVASFDGKNATLVRETEPDLGSEPDSGSDSAESHSDADSSDD